MSMRDRSNGADNNIPFRPRFIAPARNGSIANWHDPRGVRMYWRSKFSNGLISTSFPDWDDFANIVSGPLSPVGGVVTDGRTLNITYDLAGRIIPHSWMYTVRTVSKTGSVSNSLRTLSILAAGEYTISINAPDEGSAEIRASSNEGQVNIPAD